MLSVTVIAVAGLSDLFLMKKTKHINTTTDLNLSCFLGLFVVSSAWHVV